MIDSAAPHSPDFDQADAYLSIRGLGVNFSGSRAVGPIDLDVDAGQFVTLLGPSGCGKTTTLRSVAGIVRPDTGMITVGGTVVTSSLDGTDVVPEKRDVGMVFQSYALWPHMKVKDNVAFPLRSRRFPRAEVNARVGSILETVGLAKFADRLPSQLSGGQQQRVALARALVYQPKLLLMDEPLSNLDASIRQTMRNDIRRLQQKSKITTLYVTHDQEEALAISDRIVVMNEGRILQIGTPEELMDRPTSEFVAQVLGPASFVEATVSSVTPGGGTARIQTHGTPLAVDTRAASPLQVGQKVLLCTRPRHVQVEGAAPADDPRRSVGLVVAIRRSGVVIEYDLDIGVGVLRGTSLADFDLRIGDFAGLRVIKSIAL